MSRLAVFLAVSLSQGAPSAEDSAKALSAMNQGHACWARWDPACAAEEFGRAAKLDPGSFAARYNAALALLFSDRPAESAAILRDLSKTHPESSGASYLLGLALLRSGRAQEAAEILQRVGEREPAETGARYQLAVALQESEQIPEAIEAYRRVIALDRLHIGAYYRLSMLLRRQGETEEADRLLLRFEKNKATLGPRVAELESKGFNRFTEPVEPPRDFQPAKEFAGLVYRVHAVDEADPPVHPLAVVDVERDFQSELLGRSRRGAWKIWRGKGEGFTASALPVSSDAEYRAALVGDYDNDGADDAIWIGPKRSFLLQQGSGHEFRDATKEAGLEGCAGIDGAWADEDHDGDLDLFIANGTPQLRLFRNRGDGSFFDDSPSLFLPKITDAIAQVRAADIDGDDSVDLILGGGSAEFVLFQSSPGQYSSETRPPRKLPFSRELIGIDDVDNDGNLDIAWIRSHGSQSAIEFSQESIRPIPLGALRPLSGTLLDIDADGFLDLVLLVSDGLRMWRNAGSNGWQEIPEASKFGAGGSALLAFSRGARTDILVARSDGASLLREESSRERAVLRLKLEGTKSNRSGLGALVDIRAGSARIVRQVASPLMQIGVAGRSRLDSVKVVWTNGATDAKSPVEIAEPLVMVEPAVTLGSCPYLYVLDGGSFRFVTDILGNAPLGLSYAPGKYLSADTSEIVWVGRSDESPSVILEVTDELPEVLYLDEAKLLVVDSPPGVETHSTDKLRAPPFVPDSEIWAVGEIRNPRKAWNDRGEEIQSLLAEVDGETFGPSELLPNPLRGLARPHQLVMDFGEIDAREPLVLILTGWLQYGDASVNIAASQNPNLPMPFPVLEMQGSEGEWMPVDVAVGAPAGKTKTILVDLAKRLAPGVVRLRLRSALEIYWDRIALGRRLEAPIVSEIRPTEAALRHRGVSKMIKPVQNVPATPRYEELLAEPPWRRVPEGWVTRYGDVLPLVLKTDDRYVVMNCGDALRLVFPVGDLPKPREGWKREYFFFSDGWDKDSDHNIHTGNTVEPYPRHGLDDQRYGWENSKIADPDWLFEYNTRWVPFKSF